ncbi:MAG: conjugal transfer protein TraN [Alphaproteobacteria bacterium]|nr:conjugal transfer protein TraN [Alphaproteobacteria bacterium]
MKKFLIVFSAMIFLETDASMDSSFSEGAWHAASMTQGVDDNIKSGKDQTNIPQFQGEITIDTDELQKSREHLKNHEYGKDLEEIHNTRKIYIVDDTDPIIVRSENVLKDQKTALEEAEEIIESKDGETIETCEDCPDEEYYVTGRREKKRHVDLDRPPYISTGGSTCNHGTFRVVVTIPYEKPEAFREDGVWNIQFTGKTENGADIYEHYLANGVPIIMKKTILQNEHPWQHPGRCVMTDPLLKFVVGSPDILRELLSGTEDRFYNWGRLGTAHLHHRIVNDKRQHYFVEDGTVRHCEELMKQGLCRYHKRKPDPPSNRYWKGMRVYDSWGDTITYACRLNCKDTCKMLKARGCSREPDPECLQRSPKGKCIRWRWKFRCKDRIGSKKYKFSGKNAFCLGGDCIDSSYESDKDMAQAMGYLSILEAARKDMKEINNGQNVEIFKGNPKGCVRHCFGISDCCTCGSAKDEKGKGWGVSLGLTKCSPEEKELAQLRGEKKCVLVGTYCVERESITKTCIRKKTVFCCFGSKFAKLLQEQGKPQLGQNFGSPEHPNCRGFTADELSRIDFSKLDLSEIVDDVMDKFKKPPEEHFAKGMELEHIREQVKKQVKEQLKDNTGAERESVYLKENLKHMTSSMKGDNK